MFFNDIKLKQESSSEISIHDDDLAKNIYAEVRYNENYSPICIYLPSNDLLFKMMRAAIGIEDIKDLWFWSGQEG